MLFSNRDEHIQKAADDLGQGGEKVRIMNLDFGRDLLW